MKQCHLITSTTFSSQEMFEKILVESFDLTKVSVRDLFLDKLRNQSESELAKNINKYLHSGELVPAELISELIKEKLIGIENGLLITGYPRTKEQFESLTELLTESGFKISRLWILELQNIYKLISERGNESTREQIMEKFNSTIRQNEQIAKLINNPKITSKVDFEYAMDWTTEKIKMEIKAMHNTVYN
ncbi:nucleoside monophosphate kinase [Winogradskyella sp. ECml5-4]|uniref:nucleoside monophosphate kinase n=1 Tax=Winogradskyella sp. ECml5-4 TaxID=3110975 RepID=UPI002FF0885B